MRIVFISLVAVLLIGAAARADSTIVWSNDIWMRLTPSADPLVAADLTFSNGLAHRLNEEYTMDLGDVTIRVRINSNGGLPDTVTITTDEDHYAWPDTMNCPDGDVCTVPIFPMVEEIG